MTMEEKSNFEVICPKKKIRINPRTKSNKILFLPYFWHNRKTILGNLIYASGELVGVFSDVGVETDEPESLGNFSPAKTFLIKLLIL